MKKLSILFVFAWLTFHGYTQRTTETIEKGGKKYYLHTVQSGATLFSICKEYEVSVDEVSALNPQLNGVVKLGQKIVIPIIGESAKSFSYTIKEGETFFGIMKKYNLKEEEILKLNPGITKNISVGQVILLPGDYMKYRNEVNQSSKVADTIIVHEVLEHETLYSISKRFMLTVDELAKLNNVSSNQIKPGMTLKVPIYGKEAKEVAIRSLQDVNNKIDTVKPILEKANTSKDISFLLPFNADKQGDPTGAIATEFYMGAQIALDSLLKLGYEGNVFVHDVGNDTSDLMPVLRKQEVISSGLLIGPFSGDNLEKTVSFCLANKINLVSPIVGTTSYLKNNPFVFNATTSDITLAKKLAKYVYNNHQTEQVILVKVGSKDNELYQAFRTSFMKLGPKKIYEVGEKELNSVSKKGKNLVFVVLSRDRIFSTTIANSLMNIASKSTTNQINLFGTRDWLNYDDIPSEVKNKLNFQYCASVNFDVNSDEVKKLKKIYRSKYNTQLTKYAAQGFDVTMHFIQTNVLHLVPERGVINHFQMKETLEGNGKENEACFIFKQINFKVQKIAEVNE
jgi:LysM repeat protein/ABC-type branched-subunit amino acid transport system substrate-binding protein